MKRFSSFILILLSLVSCEKDPENTSILREQEFLQTHIFNGHSQWRLIRMEADTKRKINGDSTSLWGDQFPACRLDNVYQFGTLGTKIASIHVDEGNSSCNPEEPDFISQGIVLDFSSDYKKAAAFVKGATMVKLFDLPYDSHVKNFDFNHSWEFEALDTEKVVVKISLPADQSAGMVENAAVVWVTFERHK